MQEVCTRDRGRERERERERKKEREHARKKRERELEKEIERDRERERERGREHKRGIGRESKHVLHACNFVCIATNNSIAYTQVPLSLARTLGTYIIQAPPLYCRHFPLIVDTSP
jgi:hypothetical protein